MKFAAPPAVLVLLAVAVLGAPAARADGDAKPIDLDGVMDALRPLVGDPAWKTVMDPAFKSGLEGRRAGLPAERRTSWLAGYEDGRGLQAQVAGEVPTPRAWIAVCRFDTPEHANAHVAAERADAEEVGGSAGRLMGFLASSWTKGAGVRHDLSGFGVSHLMRGVNGPCTLDTVAAALDRVTVMITVVLAEELDHGVLDQGIDRAAAVIRDPAAAKALPPMPVPRPFKLPLILRVLDGEGKPVPLAHARLGWPASKYSWHSKDGDVENGKAVFRSLTSEVTIDVWGATAADGTRLPWAPAHVEGVARDAGEVTIRLEPGATISGHVRTADGRGVGAVQVHATRAGGTWIWRSDVLSTAKTDPDGAFRLVGLGKDDCRLHVESAAAYAAEPAVTAKAGAEGIDLVVKAATKVVVTVLDWSGAPVAGAEVHVELTVARFEMRRVAEAETDAKGEATLQGLDPDLGHVLSVGPPYQRRDLLPIERHEGWKPISEAIRLERGFIAKGLVTDVHGVPAKARVWWKPDEHTAMSVDTDDRGTFHVDRLPYAPVPMGAAPLDLTRTQPQRWTPVTPEKPEIVLVMGQPPPRLVVDSGTEGQAVHFIPEEAGASGQSKWSELNADGRVSFGMLDAKRSYTVWIPPASPDSDLCLYLTGFHVSDADVIVALAPGRKIKGRVTGLPPGSAPRVWVVGPDSAYIPGKVAPGGEYEVRGLPPGSWKVEARSRAGKALYFASAVVEAGGTTDLELKPQ